MTAYIPAVSPAALRDWLRDGDELAILDAREEESFSASHLLHAANLPLSRLEALAPALLPRPGVRIALTDAGEGVARRAAVRLAELGYAGVHLLDGGNDGWAAAGFPLYSGVHVPSKAFAEVLEHEWDTPHITARDLVERRARGEKITLLDARPFEEHHNHTVPGSTFVPGAELPLRIADLVRDPDELVVVHCGGRTRSIIGAQALISAGLPNRVVSLKDGTMAWALEGLDLAFGAEGRPPSTVSAEARAFAAAAGARVAAEAGVRTVARAEFEAWRAEADERTFYVFDVRTPEEYREGHLPGSLSAPGGQLVQETDAFVAVLGARIALVDDAGLGRARITAFWLKQLGWNDVVVLDGGLGDGPLETGPSVPRVLGLSRLDDDGVERISPRRLLALLGDRGVEVIDLALSKTHKAGHVPGAWFAVRARLADRLTDRLPEGTETVVLTSEDGVWARLAAADLRAAGVAGVPGKPRLLLLGGGNQAWAAAGQPLEKGISRALDAVDDVWFTPRERPGDVARHMTDYLNWEIELPARLADDPDNRFRLLRRRAAA